MLANYNSSILDAGSKINKLSNSPTLSSKYTLQPQTIIHDNYDPLKNQQIHQRSYSSMGNNDQNFAQEPLKHIYRHQRAAPLTARNPSIGRGIERSSYESTNPIIYTSRLEGYTSRDLGYESSRASFIGERPSLANLYMKNYNELRKRKESISGTGKYTARSIEETEVEGEVEDEGKIDKVNVLNNVGFIQLKKLKKDASDRLKTEPVPELDNRGPLRDNFSNHVSSQRIIHTEVSTCCLCENAITEENLTRLRICKHEFHSDCINQFLKGEIKQKKILLSCPLKNCNSVLTPDDLCKCLDIKLRKK